ncbi:hypothetical protein P153DRAFT_389324 [Dothidotthia symphoricarpi CBS 119687]|uniref:Uncharacterized protein n=1 Tax=Dothidotthia symphoricarpi CBS 119687 TaxID=1392245 RepID=A0A6A6A430_9PLEO|nr:uncharacterized protein P153DRAFT_389324 [Dothidotthia symphoricarpi CBS 119687]KAF2125874.1 hypothetical protein P153DRAFT_389324 [Dothidotthia symphoricarpi CBS 119687]
MATTLLSLLSTTLLSTYGLTLSYKNITLLQKYQAKSEKAAEWSFSAARRLKTTQTTQAAGTVSLLLSLVTSAALLVLQPPCDSTSSRFVAPLALAAVVFAARVHMARFWNTKEQVRVPFMTDYNDAARGSEKVVGVLSVLAFSWGWEVVEFGMAGKGVWVEMLVSGVGWVGRGLLGMLCVIQA